MKLIMTIIERRETKTVTRALIAGGFQVTKLDSSGGFLNTKSTTLLSAVRDEQVTRAIEIIRSSSSQRDVIGKLDLSHSGMPRANMPNMKYSGEFFTGEVNCGGATVFVLNVDHMEKI